jgi:hypothetical protein
LNGQLNHDIGDRVKKELAAFNPVNGVGHLTLQDLANKSFLADSKFVWVYPDSLAVAVDHY